MMDNDNFIIAIDGFSSCGKSTLAKRLAKTLKIQYIDSGALYRATTLHLLKLDIEISNLERVILSLKTLDVSFKFNDLNCQTFLDGSDVSEEIRKLYVANEVSKVSSIPQVREKIVGILRHAAKTTDLVMDGRDIGTNVFPRAQVKIFMTADPVTRAERRHKELRAKAQFLELSDILNNISQRDFDDTNRADNPLVPAPDAYIVDNTHMTEQEQFNEVIQIIKTLFPKISFNK